MDPVDDVAAAPLLTRRRLGRTDLSGVLRVGGVSYPRNARSALRMTATSTTS